MKQEELFLTRKQSLHLQELGLDMKDAAFQWAKMVGTWDDEEPNAYKNKWRIYKNEPFIVQNFESWDMIPTYTLQEVLAYIPFEINNYELFIDYPHNTIFYYNFTTKKECHSEQSEDYNILNSAYQMLCWTIENGYLKTK